MKQMKKPAVIILGIALLSIFSGFTAANPAKEAKYYTVVAWYLPKENPKNLPYGNMQPIVGNVVYVDCDYHTKTTVEVQFTDYFNAYYKKNVGASSLKSVKAYEFDSESAAEKSRREWISINNNSKDRDLLMVQDFSVLCDD